MQFKREPYAKAARIAGIRPEIAFVQPLINEVLTNHGKTFLITSGTEGKHGRGSLHFSGGAIDIGVREWLPSEIKNVANELRASLSVEFDVVVEGNHIHVEFQPKDCPK